MDSWTLPRAMHGPVGILDMHWLMAPSTGIGHPPGGATQRRGALPKSVANVIRQAGEVLSAMAQRK